MVQDTTTESSEDEKEDVGSKKNNQATRPLPSQNVDATSVLLSTETEGDVTGTDNDPDWASLEEEIEATSADGGNDEKESKVR